MIYFIQSGRSDFVKVGHCAGKPRARLGQLQVGNPEELRLIAVKEGGAREEAVFHERFAHLHVRGEWFRWDDELRDAARPLLEDPDTIRDQRIKGIRALVAMAPDAYDRLFAPDRKRKAAPNPGISGEDE
jgi:hypothetical protein